MLLMLKNSFMTQKLVLSFILISFFSSVVFGQNNLGKSDDAARIALNVYIPEQAESVPAIAESLYRDKISQMLTNYSLSGSNDNGRFIVVPVLSVLGKEVTATAPAMTVLSIQTTLYIGDGYEGIKFSTISLASKGVGQNETKAYIDAIKKIKVVDPAIQNFIETGKRKILEYYNSNCDFTIKRATTLAGQNNFDEAIFTLTNVPEVAKACFDKSMEAVLPIFKKAIDYKCSQSLARAKNIWSAGQDLAAANEVANQLANIDPSASCFSEANKFASIVAKRVLELDKREWNFKLKQQQDEVDIRKATIKAARDIGVAYGNNQPKTVYNTTLIRGWW